MIPDLELSTKLFLDKSIVAYGASDTGKSVITRDIMYHLRDAIDQYVIFAGNADCADDYEKLGAKRPLIHKGLDMEVFRKIWDRQDMMTAVYTRANNPDTIKSLFAKLRLEKIEKFIKELDRKKQTDIAELSAKYKDEEPSKITEEGGKIHKQYSEFIQAIYKYSIKKFRIRLTALDLNQEEKYTLQYIDFNPRILIVIDDCGSDLWKHRNDPLIQDMFTQGRHLYITFILALQDDKMLPAELRKNAMVSIFTTNICATAMFNRTSNYYDKSVKQKAKEAIVDTFTDGSPFRKLVYIRKGDKFFRCVATPRDKIEMGTNTLNNFCEKISRADTSTMNEQNQFYKLFKI